MDEIGTSWPIGSVEATFLNTAEEESEARDCVSATRAPPELSSCFICIVESLASVQDFGARLRQGRRWGRVVEKTKAEGNDCPRIAQRGRVAAQCSSFSGRKTVDHVKHFKRGERAQTDSSDWKITNRKETR